MSSTSLVQAPEPTGRRAGPTIRGADQDNVGSANLQSDRCKRLSARPMVTPQGTTFGRRKTAAPGPAEGR